MLKLGARISTSAEFALANELADKLFALSRSLRMWTSALPAKKVFLKKSGRENQFLIARFFVSLAAILFFVCFLRGVRRLDRFLFGDRDRPNYRC